jgi:hypothetical protein
MHALHHNSTQRAEYRGVHFSYLHTGTVDRAAQSVHWEGSDVVGWKYTTRVRTGAGPGGDPSRRRKGYLGANVNVSSTVRGRVNRWLCAIVFFFARTLGSDSHATAPCVKIMLSWSSTCMRV